MALCSTSATLYLQPQPLRLAPQPERRRNYCPDCVPAGLTPAGFALVHHVVSDEEGSLVRGDDEGLNVQQQQQQQQQQQPTCSSSIHHPTTTACIFASAVSDGPTIASRQLHATFWRENTHKKQNTCAGAQWHSRAARLQATHFKRHAHLGTAMPRVSLPPGTLYSRTRTAGGGGRAMLCKH